jgi:hypothetical protein
MLRRLLLPALVAGAATLLAGTPAAAHHRPAPAAPTAVVATNGFSTITLAWTQPAEGPRPEHFRVYEGDTVVARNTTTRVTVTGLGFDSTHTFRVAAVSAAGVESPLSAPITHRLWVSGMQPVCRPGPGPLTATDVDATAASLAWPATGEERLVRVSVAGRDFVTREAGLRVGGLRPGTGYAATIVPLDCHAPAWPGTLRFTTPPGPAELPGEPTGLTVAASTDRSVDLSWTPPAGGAPVAGYALWSGGERIGTSAGPSARFAGLWRGTARTVAVTALTAEGAESAATPAITARTRPCTPVTPAPVRARAAAVSPSSIELSWTSVVEAASYTVHDGDTAVATVGVPSARLTGLASGSRHRLRVVTNPTDGCPASPASRPLRVRTPDGPPGRPAAPADLRAVRVESPTTPVGTVGLAWTAPAGDPPAGGYRIYEGAILIGAADGPEFRGQVPPATSHVVTVVAVDAAGNESAPSNAVTVTGSFFLPPAPPPGGGPGGGPVEPPPPPAGA